MIILTEDGKKLVDVVSVYVATFQTKKTAIKCLNTK